jgi:DNA-binding beta-propeller fold protein YncE
MRQKTEPIDLARRGRGHRSAILCALLSVMACASARGTAQSPQPFHVIHTIPILGQGNWDYVYADSQARRLYVTLGDSVVILNLDTEKPIGRVRIGGFVHGVAIVQETDSAFVSSGEWPGEAKSPDQVVEFDLKTLVVKRHIHVGSNPDCIIYDHFSKRVYAFNHGNSRSVSVIEPASGRVERTIALGAPPEYALSDGMGRIDVNLEDADQVAAIDTRKGTVVARWLIAPCDGPSALTRDPQHGLLFSACANKTMVASDEHKGKVIAVLPIGGGPDAALFQPSTGLIFSANYEGTLTVLHQDGPQKYHVVQSLATAPDARTFAMDAHTGRLYLPVADMYPLAPGQEIPKIKPNTFRILVVGAAR